jgi:hypothetical protein
MFGAEKVADMFDELHEENKREIQRGFQGWVDEIYREEGESVSFYGAAVTAGVLDTLYGFAGGMGAGLVDLTRLGEGVKEGTAWGVAKDGLRAVSVFGGAFRVVRLAAAELKLGGQMSCVLSSSAKAAALGGHGRLSAFVSSLTKPLGGQPAVFGPNFGGLNFTQFVSNLKTIGLNGSWKSVTKLDDIVAMAKEVRGPVLFDIQWNAGGGHTMVAFRDLFGRVRFADQWGAAVPNLSQLNTLGKLHPQAMILHDAAVVLAARWGAVGNFLTAPLYSIPPSVMQGIETEARRQTGRAVKQDATGPGGGPSNSGKVPNASAQLPPAASSAGPAVVTPRPYQGPIVGKFEFTYAGGIPGKPVVGQTYQVQVQFTINGKVFTSVVPFRVASASGKTYQLVSANVQPLNVGPDGYPPRVIAPGNQLTLSH